MLLHRSLYKKISLFSIFVTKKIVIGNQDFQTSNITPDQNSAASLQSMTFSFFMTDGFQCFISGYHRLPIMHHQQSGLVASSQLAGLL